MRHQISRDASPQHFVAIDQVTRADKETRRAPMCRSQASRRREHVVSFTSLEDSDATVQGALDVLDLN